MITQHNTVYFRPQPFFTNTQQANQMQHDLLAFWQNPAASDNAALLNRYGVSFVLVPQIVDRPDTIGPMFRWRPPAPEAIKSVSLDHVPYLRLVYDANGARVYRVIGGAVQIERF